LENPPHFEKEPIHILKRMVLLKLSSVI
jgi:hypothetical protein